MHRRHLVAAVSALAVALSAGSATAQTPATLDEILAGNTRAMGGAEALDGVRSVLRQRNATLFTLRQAPGKHLVLLLNEAGGVRYAEGFDGEIGWEILDDGPKVRTSERAATALWHTTQFPGELAPLATARARGHEVRLLGTERMDGVEHHRILFTLSDGFEREYFLDATTLQIVRARDTRRFHAYEEEVQPIESVWGDFRAVEGIVVPFTSGERNYETGERLSGGTLVQVRLNVTMPDEVFALDGSIQPFLDFVRGAAR